MIFRNEQSASNKKLSVQGKMQAVELKKNEIDNRGMSKPTALCKFWSLRILLKG